MQKSHILWMSVIFILGISPISAQSSDMVLPSDEVNLPESNLSPESIQLPKKQKPSKAKQLPRKAPLYCLGAALGYSFSGYREETYSLINRYLNTLTYIIDGSIERGKLFHSLNLGFFMGNPESKTPENAILLRSINAATGEDFYSAYITQYLFIRAYLDYALDCRLWGNETFPGYLGGAFRADAYIQFAYYPSITGLFSLDIHASQKWIINPENQLTLSAGFPVFGFAVRPPYAGADHALILYAAESPLKVLTLGNIVSLHNYWAVFGNLKYHHKVNSLLSLYSGLNFELSRLNSPKPRIDARLTLNTGLAFTF